MAQRKSPGSGAMAPCERWFEPAGKAQAVVLVTHGLNLKPACMDELAAAFAKAGYLALRPSFTGHCGEARELQEIAPESWDDDARRFHQLVAAKASELGVPLYFAGYSFGCLIYQSMRGAPFAKRIFFAPALETKIWFPLALFIVDLWPDLVFRTMIPDGYYAHEYGGFRSVLALNHFLKIWRRNKREPDSGDTLMFLDPKDELVHGRKLKRLAKKRKGWRYRRVSNKGSTLQRAYHHQIIDSASVGEAEWGGMVKDALAFLGEE